jgi:hypothetical protein
MRELRRDADTEQNTQPRKDDKQPSNPQGDGHKTGGKSEASPKAVIWGEPVRASLDETEVHPAQKLREEKLVEVNVLVISKKADQAERSLA